LIARLTGDTDRAFAASSEGSTLAQTCGSQLWQARFEVQSGILVQGTGDEEQVVALGLSALAGARRVADSRTVLLAAVLLLPWGPKHPEIRRSLAQPTVLRSLARSLHQYSIEVLLVTQLAMEAAFNGDIDAAAHYGFDALSLSGEQEFSSYSACGLVVSAHIATALGDYPLAARIHGRFGDAIEAKMPQMYRRDYQEMIDLLRRGMGPVAFDSARGAGARESWSSTVGEAQEYLSGVRPSEQGRRLAFEDRRGAGGVLTERQLEVVNLLASGLTNREIADRLGVTTKTVMHHTGAIYSRLGVRGRSETVAWAVKEGLIAAQPPGS
jgi:DNA-binding CsgD family transcriptional regulator